MTEKDSQDSKSKRLVVPIKLMKPTNKANSEADVISKSDDSNNWVKREFAVFMKSVTILNQGLGQIKGINN